MTRRCIAAIVLSLLCVPAVPSAAQAGFGIVPGSLAATAENADGTIDLQAGSHPYVFNVSFDLNLEESGKSEGGELRDVIVDLPPGLVGNPQAVPRCARQEFEGATPQCSFDTQVGVIRGNIPGLGQAHGPIYNLVPPPGVAAQLGFSLFGFTALQYGSVRSEEGYGLRVLSPSIPIEIVGAEVEIWGTPADPAHDAERGRGFEGEEPHPSQARLLPFLTLPAGCGAPLEYTVEVDSKLAPGQFVGETAQSLDAGGNPAALIGCESVPFGPGTSAVPTSASAETSSGLDFELKLPNEGLLVPGAIAETEPEKTEVTLPEGITVNPSLANGLAACSFAQYKSEHAKPLPGQGCPAASKIGTLLAKTPLLEEPIEGSVYLAAPRDNPFDSFMAIYIVARVPKRGVLVKQAGEVVADPVSGQLKTTVEDLPPLPFSSLEVRLREGPRAPLITPNLCGTYTTQAKLYPFSDPGTPVERTVPFKVLSGAGGGACASSEAQLPNSPTLQAGTMFPLAGAYSPFLFKVSRADGEQRFGAINATLPEGVVGKLAGIPYCSEAQIAAAQARGHEGGGAQELSSPSCPQASQVGVVNAGAGAGSEPFFAGGKAYLAGPYKGAPLSMAIITPAVAGPFDLGVVVVRAGVYVDEATAQITVKSDPLPTILRGIPLDVRSVAVQVTRDQFTLNPTSCEEMAVSGEVISTAGAVAQLKNRFQVGACGALPYRPKLSLQLKGSVRRTANPQLIATLTARPGEANTAFAQVKLPPSAFIDNAHIATVCTRVQFAAGAGNGASCPPGSIYGRAEVVTPLLDYPLKGKVILRSSDHPLPDLLVAFSGPPSQPIHFALAGRTDSVKGALRNTFQSAPDVPVSKFRLELFGGKRGLVEMSGGFCRHPRATVKLRGQNGAVYNTKPEVQSACEKAKGKHKKRRRRGR